MNKDENWSGLVQHRCYIRPPASCPSTEPECPFISDTFIIGSDGFWNLAVLQDLFALKYGKWIREVTGPLFHCRPRGLILLTSFKGKIADVVSHET